MIVKIVKKGTLKVHQKTSCSEKLYIIDYDGQVI